MGRSHEEFILFISIYCQRTQLTNNCTIFYGWRDVYLSTIITRLLIEQISQPSKKKENESIDSTEIQRTKHIHSRKNQIVNCSEFMDSTDARPPIVPMRADVLHLIACREHQWPHIHAARICQSCFDVNWSAVEAINVHAVAQRRNTI